MAPFHMVAVFFNLSSVVMVVCGCSGLNLVSVMRRWCY